MPGERVEHEPGQPRREHRVAVGDPADRGDQLGAGDGLGDVAARAAADGADHVLGGVADRQREEARLGRRGLDPPHHLAPPPPGRCTSRSTTSGRCSRDRGHRLVDVGGLGDHLDQAGAGRGQLGAHAAAEHRVVVDDHDAHRAAGGCSHRVLRRCGPRQVQPDLGALARRGADLGGAAVPLHPVHDAAPHPEPVLGDVVRVEAGAPVADEHVDGAAGDLGVHVDPAGPGVLGRVGDRLAGGLDERPQRLVEVAVADRDHVDGDPVGVLDLGGGSAQRAGQAALVGRLLAVQPRPEVALLGPGQPGHRGRVGGVLLDQRQRLQHRVVQVGGHVGPLLGADPLGPLGAQVGGEPEDPGPDHEAEPDDAERAGDQRRPGRPERAAAEPDEDRSATTSSHARRDPGVRRPAAVAEHDPDRVEPPGGVQPALALRPRRPGATAARCRPVRSPAARRRRRRRRAPATRIAPRPSAASAIVGPMSVSRRTDRAGGRRGWRSRRRACRSRTASPRAAASTSRRTARSQPAEHGRHDEPDPHPQHRNGEVPGETARDAAEDRRLGVAGGAPDVAVRVGGCRHDLPSIAERRLATHGQAPRPDPELDAGQRSGSGSSPMVCGPRTHA